MISVGSKLRYLILFVKLILVWLVLIYQFMCSIHLYLASVYWEILLLSEIAIVSLDKSSSIFHTFKYILLLSYSNFIF